MAQFTQNGERLVKVSTKQTGKLRKFFGKIFSGIKHVVYAPGALFDTLKDIPKAVAYRVKAKIDDQEKSKKEENETKNVPGKAPKQEDKKEKAEKKEPKQATDTAAKDDKEKTKVITPLTLAQMHHDNEKKKAEKNPKEDNSEKENEPAEAEEITRPIEPTPVQEEPTKQGEPDETVLNNLLSEYGDLRDFATWADYYNSFTEKERMKQIEAEEFLGGTAFNKARLAQANETIKLCDAKEAIRQAEKDKLLKENEERKEQKEANKKEKERLEAEIKEIDNDQDRLTTEMRRARTRVNKIDQESEEAAQLKAKMEQIIGPKPKEKTPEEKQDEKVDEIMNGILKNVYGDTKEEAKKDDSPKLGETKGSKEASHLANVISQVAEQKDEGDTKEEPKTEISPDLKKIDIEPQINIVVKKPVDQPEETSKSPLLDEVDTMFDKPAIAKDGTITLTDNPDMDKKQPGLDYMGFDPETRAEIGQEAFKRMLDSNSSLTFEEAKAQVAAEYREREEKPKGKTR